ncbi:AAA family ATPase [Rhodococcus hoagii]|nr:AAA family ATPase [Prescottella equi]
MGRAELVENDIDYCPPPADLDLPPDELPLPPGRAAFDDIPASMAPATVPPVDLAVPDPASNSGVERAVLAAMFETGSDSPTLIMSRIAVDDFYLGNHQSVFGAFAALIQRGDPVSVLTVEHELRGMGAPSTVTNLAWLYELSRDAPPTAEVPVLVRLLTEYSDQRRFRTALLAAQADLSAGMRAQDLAARHRLRLDQIERADADQLASIGNLAMSELEDIDRRATNPEAEDVILSGHRELDEIIGGFRAPDVVVPIAPPGAGKSLIVTDWFRHATMRQGKTAVLFALEMSKAQMTRRILAAEAKVLHSRLEHHPDQLDDDDWTRIARRAAAISEAKMFICDIPDLTIAAIDAHCTALKRQHGLDMVIVDHQGLVTADGENRNIQVSRISWG